MLTAEDNKFLTQIGPGTPMGALFRQYWIPLLMSSELPDRDGDIKRVRILGENLVAFRDTSDRIGLLADNCSHRGVSLFFGRNEENGLRCVYHGWKYDVTGRCVDMPNEPEESNFNEKIRHTAYPCVERNGAIWAYLGPRKEPPPLPDLEWTKVPDGHYALGKTFRECNWMQALEGDVDNAHVSFLHSRLEVGPDDGLASQIMFSRKAPRLQVVDTDYGVMYASRRDADDAKYNYRIVQYLFPCFTMITTGGAKDHGTVPSHMWVPIDDENVMQWGVRWNPTEPLSEDLRREGAVSSAGPYLPNDTGWYGSWHPEANKSNDYMLDREAQRHIRFSGVPNIPLQDKAMTESMGPVANRALEHLGTTDAMLIRVRRRLIGAAKALQDHDVTPPGVDQPQVYGVRSAIVNLAKETNWVEATREVVKAFTGLPAASSV